MSNRAFYRSSVHRAVLLLLLLGTASLGGCYVAPYPGHYYYGHPHYFGWR